MANVRIIQIHGKNEMSKRFGTQEPVLNIMNKKKKKYFSVYNVRCDVYFTLTHSQMMSRYIIVSHRNHMDWFFFYIQNVKHVFIF